LDSGVAAPPAAALQPLKQALEACQRQQLRLALEQTKGNWAAARLLETDSSNLHKLAKRLGVKG
jgi:anaerobic nitric oxide reductase transcription regulator